MLIQFTEREIQESELDLMKAGFERDELAQTAVPHVQVRYDIIALADSEFIGCTSGLANGNWFYITDLWLDEKYRGRGIGKDLLKELEKKVISLGIANIYLWTASYEAPEFYKRNGYTVFFEFEDYYAGGESRLGFSKKLL